MAKQLTQKIVKALLHYDRKSGRFTWRRRESARWNTRYAGKEAGALWSPDGGKNTYRVIRIFDYPYLAHRLAVLYVTGRWPKSDTDHRDRDGLNNAWRNLRHASKKQNGLNRGMNRNNKTGIKGVSKMKNGRFRATVQIDGKWRQLGIFLRPEDAAAAYRAEVRLAAPEFGATS